MQQDDGWIDQRDLAHNNGKGEEMKHGRKSANAVEANRAVKWVSTTYNGGRPIAPSGWASNPDGNPNPHLSSRYRTSTEALVMCSRWTRGANNHRPAELGFKGASDVAEGPVFNLLREGDAEKAQAAWLGGRQFGIEFTIVGENSGGRDVGVYLHSLKAGQWRGDRRELTVWIDAAKGGVDDLFADVSALVGCAAAAVVVCEIAGAVVAYWENDAADLHEWIPNFAGYARGWAHVEAPELFEGVTLVARRDRVADSELPGTFFGCKMLEAWRIVEYRPEPWGMDLGAPESEHRKRLHEAVRIGQIAKEQAERATARAERERQRNAPPTIEQTRAALDELEGPPMSLTRAIRCDLAKLVRAYINRDVVLQRAAAEAREAAGGDLGEVEARVPGSACVVARQALELARHELGSEGRACEGLDVVQAYVEALESRLLLVHSEIASAHAGLDVVWASLEHDLVEQGFGSSLSPRPKSTADAVGADGLVDFKTAPSDSRGVGPRVPIDPDFPDPAMQSDEPIVDSGSKGDDPDDDPLAGAREVEAAAADGVFAQNHGDD